MGVERVRRLKGFTGLRGDRQRKTIKVASQNLRNNLAQEYRRYVDKLRHLTGGPAETVPMCEVILLLSRMQAELDRVISEIPTDPELVGSFTDEFTEIVLDAFDREPAPSARLALAEALKILTFARMSLPARKQDHHRIRTIQIHSEFLFQAHTSLFPAERMLLAAARTTNGVSTLTALFEVTGKAHSVHVQADAHRLARALIAMDAADSFLLGWFHSHPGTGPGETTPSSIDQRQQEKWLEDYSSSLLGWIMVEDGHFRLWCPAIDQGKVKVQISGAGIERKGEENVYRLQV